MALPILDGNQSATTLSSILTGGEHIPAHTVVSLGTQAITDISGAVSGSVVSISNFPATQPVSIASVTIGNTVTIAGTVTVGNSVTIGSLPALVAGTAQIGSVTASISNSVTIGSLPAISGTVTATIRNGEDAILNDAPSGYTVIRALSHWFDDVVDNEIKNTSQTNPLPISGTVTANIGNISDFIGGGYNNLEEFAGAGGIGVNVVDGTVALGAGTSQIGSVTASISNSVTIGSLPAISGTVTADVADPNNVIASGVESGLGAYAADIANTPLPISGTVTANTFALQGTTVTTSNFTSTTASTVLANYNATRKVLTIFNEGAGNLHVCAGATCTTIAYQVRLSAGDYYEVPNHQTTITHSAVFATAGTARVTQVS